MVVPQSNKREQVLKLIEEKDKLEAKINELGNVLRANNVGMTDELTDSEDFPRNDIDVMAVRQARHEINCLQNDLKQLLKVIEAGLEEIHSEGSHITSPKIPPDVAMQSSTSVSNNRSPFVIVNLVSPGSPAEEAGIQLRDEIVEFGSINVDNFQDLGQIGELVRHSQNQNISLKVRRARNLIDITLVPKTWQGRGLLGCNIVPIPTSSTPSHLS
ncbi:26S proteasome non-ATPase regulatory subunit 9 [Culicoides brevitarsis]|uniref:26S proteasome non-ATPase regulatory subunit 9 n=1 Tax=Culicoides brevitarsis TaxID=469753 RepID=UPI00307C64AD